MTSPMVLQIDQVTKTFPGRGGAVSVLTGVDLDVRTGEVVAVAGRSGSGKTTLLTIAAGWDWPDTGTVTVLGQVIGAGTAIPRWASLSLVPQSLGLLDELTVAENVALPRRLAPAAARGRRPFDTEELLARPGLDHLADRHPGEVSLGEQQRTALARAMVLRPQLLLADEPVSHQNVQWAQIIMASLRDLAAGDTGCLVATHNPAALDAADRVLTLQPVDSRDPSSRTWS